jgi:hypothetical protein
MPVDQLHLAGRDLDVLCDVLRFGVLTDDQIARRFFAADPHSAATKLEALAAHGYLAPHPKWLADATLYIATRRAARVADIGLSPAGFKPGQLPHDVAVADLADYLLDHEPGAEWLTERELRRYGLDLVRESTTGRFSRGDKGVPDGVLVGPHSRVAIELERTSKDLSKYDHLFRRYAAATQFDALRWFAVGRALETRLRELIERYGLGDFVSVEPLPACIRIRRWGP